MVGQKEVIVRRIRWMGFCVDGEDCRDGGGGERVERGWREGGEREREWVFCGVRKKGSKKRTRTLGNLHLYLRDMCPRLPGRAHSLPAA